MFDLVLGIIIVAVIVIVYFSLRESQHRDDNLPAMSQSNLPAISEDVNLPVVNDLNPPVVSKSNPPMKNEPLDDDRS